MLRPGLRDLDRAVAHVHGLLPHAHHLVAEHERIFHARLRPEVAEHHGAFDLLDGIDPVAFGAQAGDALLRRLVISPRHGQFGTERRLVDVAVGRRRGDAAEGDAFHGESIPRQLADVVETGTNLAAINAGVDILAHPGLITVEDAQLAAEKGVLLELNTAPRHCLANGHIVRMAERFGCELLLNSDASSSADFESPDVTQALRKAAALGAGLDAEGLSRLHVTERKLVQKLLRL